MNDEWQNTMPLTSSSDVSHSRKDGVTRKQFRVMVVVLFLLFVASGAIGFIYPGLIPKAVKEAADVYTDAHLDALPYKIILHAVVVMVFALFGHPVALIGLFFFRRWGRSLYTVLICMSPIIWLVVGLNVSSWINAFLDELYLLGVGLMLGIAWFSPLKEAFK